MPQMTRRPVRKPCAMQTQSMAVGLVDPMAPVPVPKPRSCPDAGAADEGKRFHAYHYFNSAYPDHSLTVDYTEDLRYPPGEYPEGAYPTDPYLPDEDAKSEEHLDIDDEEDDSDDEDLDPYEDFLYDDDEDSADEEGWDPDGNEYCPEDQEVPDTSEEEPTEDEDEDGDGDGP